MPKRGLPRDLKLKKGLHYVEALLEKTAQPVIRMIPVDRITPNPWQPRQDFGDLEELAESIRQHGLLEPIIVRPIEDGFQLVAGERRLRASRLAGLEEVPCIEIDATDQQMLEFALIENLQRKDLDPFEEADAYQQLIDEFGYTHAELARVLNRSRSTVTEILSLRHIPPEIRALCREKGILTRKELLTIARQPDRMAMRLCFEELLRSREAPVSPEPVSAEEKERRPRARRSAAHQFLYRDPFGRFEVRVRLYRGRNSTSAIREALTEALESLAARE